MKVLRTCKQCNNQFYAHEYQVKKGKGKFCSVSCATTFRNLTNNPSKRLDVREKISKNHADVSGAKNPMYGRTGMFAPSYVDGRSTFKGETYKKIMQANQVPMVCKICGTSDNLHVHHIDGNRKNNDLKNLVYLCAKCHLNTAHVYQRDAYGRFAGSTINKEVV